MYLNKRVSLSASFISKLCPEAYWSKDYLMVTTQQVVCQKVELKMLQRATTPQTSVGGPIQWLRIGPPTSGSQ